VKWNGMEPTFTIYMAMVGFALPLKGCTHPTTTGTLVTMIYDATSGIDPDRNSRIESL